MFTNNLHGAKFEDSLNSIQKEKINAVPDGSWVVFVGDEFVTAKNNSSDAYLAGINYLKNTGGNYSQMRVGQIGKPTRIPVIIEDVIVSHPHSKGL